MARMASAAAHTFLTPEEYLAFERKATTKHEYLTEFRGLEEVLSLTSIGCKLRLQDIYRRIQFPEESATFREVGK